MQGPDKATYLKERYEKEMEKIEEHYPSNEKYPPRFSRGEGVLQTMAGFKNVIEEAKKASSVPIKKPEKPVFTKPPRPELELFDDSLRKRSQIH